MKFGVYVDVGQCQGHGDETFRVRSFSIFKVSFLCHLQWNLENDLSWATMSKFCRVTFLILGLFFMSRDFELHWYAVLQKLYGGVDRSPVWG